MESEIINGDCLDVMREMDSNSIDMIVTDPPYALTSKSGKGGFMGKEWDSKLPGIEIWQEALRVCKPGAFMACFGGTRTFHKLTCLIEDAGWEIRDCIMWLTGQGFPKSHNFGLEGYGTALKPAWEPIILAMKPLEGTFKQNSEKWGVAGINIDDCRVSTDEEKYFITDQSLSDKAGIFDIKNLKKRSGGHQLGRWPSNLILDEASGKHLDEMTGDKSRFFYCAKASSKEREGSTHPTMKPLALMKYLIKLLAPPNDPLLLDPFCGSGSTIKAAKELGIRSIGIELSAEYCEIARKRISC